jgi:hypothetical protein
MNLRWLLLMGLPLLVGCGRGSELQREAVSGTVTYQGKPIPDGAITFVPLKGTQGPGAGALIRDGKYTVVAGGGVPVGTYRVEMQALREVVRPQKRPGPQLDMAPKEPYLPEQYNTKSTMEVTIDAKGGQTQNFDLK